MNAIYKLKKTPKRRVGRVLKPDLAADTANNDFTSNWDVVPVFNHEIELVGRGYLQLHFALEVELCIVANCLLGRINWTVRR